MGVTDCRWDTWRNCEFNEILAFYGLGYWYTWQVSILGLGPIWQSENESLKRKAARLLDEGEVFAFGLSERQHGADIYSTEMSSRLNQTGHTLPMERNTISGMATWPRWFQPLERSLPPETMYSSWQITAKKVMT